MDKLLVIDGKAEKSTKRCMGNGNIRQPYFGTPGCGDLIFGILGEAGVTGLDVDILKTRRSPVIVTNRQK
jgi:hypothetical protein